MNLNKEVFRYVFGNRWAKINRIYNLIKNNINGTTAEELNIKELEEVVNVIRAVIIEKYITDNDFSDFLYDFSRMGLMWYDKFIKTADCLPIKHKLNFILQFVCRALTLDNVNQLSKEVICKIGYLDTRLPPYFELSKHYYALLKNNNGGKLE